MIYSVSQPGSVFVREYPYQRVVAGLRAKIKSGEYPPGAKLPTRPDLRAEYGVSDAALDRAMFELRHQRLVETQHGVGVFVCEDVDPTTIGTD